MKNIFYMPLTAAPFRRSAKYKELFPINGKLAEYIRCFWGSERPYRGNEKPSSADIVIPDTCMDIIYYIDHTEQTVTGGFCGMNDASFLNYENSKPGHLLSIFSIRFYAWGAYAFSEDSLSGTLNGFCDIQSRFRQLDALLRPQLLEKRSLEERTGIAEEFLLRQMFSVRQNHIVNTAAGQILLHKGALSVEGLARECFVSVRQLERLFHEYIGINPKKLCNLVRYQYLWQEILNNPKLHIQDAVWKYGYNDQSHLIREFKRYHAMDIGGAKRYAYQNVGNIQDS
ncbi:MAG: helix-turn-helix domain-containing protein [Lachnospiraceae bacterium]